MVQLIATRTTDEKQKIITVTAMRSMHLTPPGAKLTSFVQALDSLGNQARSETSAMNVLL